MRVQERSAPQRRDSLRNPVAEWFVLTLCLLFGVVTLVQPFTIPTPSMEATLLVGDHVLVDKLTYAPSGPVSRYLLPYRPVKRGDIIVFRYPANIGETFVKRVIGIPGDRIRLLEKQVYLNGRPLQEPYVVHRDRSISPSRDNFPVEPGVRSDAAAQQMLETDVVRGEVVVPPGKYFAMGDNRDLSLDSRYWGFVPREYIIGKPLLIWWSYDAPTEHLSPGRFSWDHIKDLAQHFFTKTRWNRTFHLIHGYPL